MNSAESSVLQVVIEQSERVLETYRIDPGLIGEHANSERRITQGGYGDRQIYELVQNGADELREDTGGEISVVLTATRLYCANQGAPITPEGAETILRMSSSRKRAGQIGRFGVGVKSVLSVSDSPEFFSSTGSFGFDKDWSTKRIRTIRPDLDEVPVLRMAQSINQDRAMAADPVLAELLGWATTVVRLPLRPSAATRLARDLVKFPSEFLLFSPHVGTVTLEDRRSAEIARRQIFQRVDGELHTIQEETDFGPGSTSNWRVFTCVHRPSEKALQAAGELHDRPEIDISWAVPERHGRESKLGEFWAYFPTKYKTTLRGIVNAPWKTSEDRQNLYGENEFNEELIDVMAALVVDSLPSLCRPDDPASYLDFTPARGREEPQWASVGLVEAVWSATAHKPSLPDQRGELRLPADVRLHPADLRPEWLEWWRQYTGRPENWAHHSVEANRLRRASAELICNTAGVSVASVREWLEALVQDRTPMASAIAIRITADMVRTKHALADQALKAQIVLTESNDLVSPVRGQIFRRALKDSLVDTISYVDDRVTAEFGALGALEVLGIHEADANGRFTAVVDQGFEGYDDARWSEFWELARLAGPASVVVILRGGATDNSQSVFVRTVSGRFREIGRCLLPGAVVPEDGSRDGSIAVDLRFHDSDRQVLREIGLSDAPRNNVDPRGEPWFESYREACWRSYLKTLPADVPRVQMKTVKVDGMNTAGPLHLLEELSDEGRAAFLRSLPWAGVIQNWALQVGGLRSGSRSVSSPLVWMARKHGRARTAKGIRPLTQCVSPALKEYGEFFPVADLPIGVAEAFRLDNDLSELKPSFWQALLDEVAESESDEFPGRVYAMLFDLEVEIPEGIGNTRCRVGDKWTTSISDEEIAVAAVRDEYDLLVMEQIPAVLVPSAETAQLMIEQWGMLSPADVIEKELRYVEQTEPMLIADEFPPLRLSHRSRINGWSLVCCKELEEITHTLNGARNETIQAAVQGKTVLVLNPRDDDLATLQAVDRMLKLNLGDSGCRAILDRIKRQENNDLRKRIRSAGTVPEKLLYMVGSEELKRKLPKGLVESERAQSGQEPNDLRIAQLAWDAHGDSVLRHHAKALEAHISDPVGSFRGDHTSRELVNDLQLPESFAGTKPDQSRDALEMVDGPVQFPGLHDYQERLAVKMFELLTRPTPQRAMLCLPTGAGKTRVAAEAVIRVIKARGLGGRPVLWIAQTDELCEQAVQSWKFVWSKVGPEGRLAISRLWSGNKAAAVKETAHLVVATDAKLESCLDTERYSWLRQAALVIVDEAHTSITSRYTQLLRSLGITRHSTERPLIGLTATPFRGFNDDETRRLVERYGGTRLDQGVFDSDPHTSLQELGMLARVEHRELAGATMQLTQEELESLSLPFQQNLPFAAEQRLGEDDDRNGMLLAEIRRLPRDWPVLLFATSVNHAKVMAARLKGMGINAVAIESATPPTERRKSIEDFRTGKIQVIANYGVLAQGFDAPATRVVIVARPTYSPNVYTQMIGRGLRGPKNGGKEQCLILDVRDNITNYQNSLTFTGFEHLWGRG
ncbi:DEAD/DEAH box helicase [Saccharopolyspora sp. NPDC050389]|uniref:DEAD/DEAH box helicase n=1 Tax=Saccharopolyspora sp. NPDC050389 TaxID=3155516 RepID=UPI0033D8FF0B